MANRIALDTNTLTALLAGSPTVLALLTRAQPELPLPVVEEVVQGWLLQIGKAEQRRREDLVGRALDRLADFHQFTATVPLLRYTEIAQGIFTNLTIGRGSRSRNDLRIAAICIAHGVPLLSRNVADFYDLPDLQLIPWQ